jgi:hypothetical protein
LLERGDESVLCELLRKTNIAHDPRETGDDFGGLDPPNRVDRTMCLGSCHGYPSHHFQSAGARPRGAVKDAPRLGFRGAPSWRTLVRLGYEAKLALTLSTGCMEELPDQFGGLGPSPYLVVASVARERNCNPRGLPPAPAFVSTFLLVGRSED